MQVCMTHRQQNIYWNRKDKGEDSFADSAYSGVSQEKCHKIAEKENINLRRSYTRKSKQCFWDTHNGKHPSRTNKVKKALKHLQTITNTQLRDFEHK